MRKIKHIASKFFYDIRIMKTSGAYLIAQRNCSGEESMISATYEDIKKMYEFASRIERSK